MQIQEEFAVLKGEKFVTGVSVRSGEMIFPHSDVGSMCSTSHLLVYVVKTRRMTEKRRSKENVRIADRCLLLPMGRRSVASSTVM